MCGRYYRRSDKQRIAEAFQTGAIPEAYHPRVELQRRADTFQPVIRASKETDYRELALSNAQDSSVCCKLDQ